MNKKIFKIKYLFIILSLIFVLISGCEKKVDDIEKTETKNEEIVEEIIESINIDDVTEPADRNQLLRIDHINQIFGKDMAVTKDDYYKYRDTKFCIIGDSIAKGAEASLLKYFRAATIDATPGREIKKVYDIFSSLYAFNRLGDLVIVSLGTNAIEGIEMKLLDDVYNRLEGRPMFLLTIVIPYKGQERNRNRDIRKFVESHENCYLIDYNKIMKPHPELFNDDHIHPNGAGGEVYAQLLFKSIADYKKAHK